jgi:3-oxoacyl-[acyl-carrier protein] reductase
VEWYQKMLPVGRWGRPEEMGALAAFLCSERAGFITGDTIRIDGGYTKSLF